MKRANPVTSALMLCLLVAPAAAQDWAEGAALRTLERPAHQRLLDRIAQPGTTIAPFETDGCSGGLSEAWQVVGQRFPDFAAAHQSRPPWEACCTTHDQAYHNAGAANDADHSFDARLAADRALQACVVDTGASRVAALAGHYDVTPDQITAAYDSIANAMFLAVRFGGGPCSGLPWRWGYGYPGCSVLTEVFD